MKIKVCHLTSVHPVFDTRIFYKECKSLERAGYNVSLLAKHNEKEIIDNISIIPFKSPGNRFLRILISPFKMFFLALKEKAVVYHFHDPELIITGLLLRIFTNSKIVYDIHEDYITSIEQKGYINPFIKKIILPIFKILEKLLSSQFHLIIAEKYYSDRFPNSQMILNYPIVYYKKTNKKKVKKNALIYTGRISEDRGALIYAQMIKKIKYIEIFLIGYCPKLLADKMRKIVGSEIDRLHIIGEWEYIDHSVIEEYYEKYEWLAGLAIFPETRHYVKKELTKFYEYMYAEIPILCSSFIVWEKFVSENNSGITVDHNDINEIKDTVRYIKDNYEESRKMGKCGLNAVLDKFNWDNEENKLIDFYRKILQK